MSALNSNSPCPCGSGKKYKKCCLNKLSAKRGAAIQSGKSLAHGFNAKNVPPPTGLLMKAVTLHQSGKLDEAETVYRSILQMNPQDSDALHYLGLIAFQKRNYSDAIQSIEAAIRINRTVSAFHCNLGNAYKAHGQFDNAISAFLVAVKLDPQFHTAYCNLGNTYLEQGSLDEAIENYRKAIRLKQDFAEAHGYLAVALQGKGRFDEAMDHYKKAINFKPNHADAYSGLASLYIDLGRFDDAKNALAKTLELQPSHPTALTMITRLKKMTSDDADWLDKALNLISQNNSALSARDNINLHFGIGKYYDDTGQYDLAFDAFLNANKLQRKREGIFDRPDFSRLVDTLISVYTPEVIAQTSKEASQSRRPVLIVGMPRSGTSLIEQIIASHPDATGAGELAYWETIGVSNLAAVTSNDFKPSFIAETASDYEKILLGYSDEATRRVVDKMPGNFIWLGLIHAIFPEARIIHAQRNPIDTCLSIFFQCLPPYHSYGTDLDDLAFYYREYARLMRHWRSVFPADLFCEVTYEDLVDDQAAWCRKIIDFVGLDWDERCLDFHNTERTVATSSSWQVRQKIYRTSKERWRNYERHLGPLTGLMDLNWSDSGQKGVKPGNTAKTDA